ncbi:hypothetical protein CFC21_000665 [Triticum aestivum]|uniref:Uncharacterized protein n=2 Tax=Triticum TaxID=4564 RepID=A0A9R0UK99_TRITD|nr:hypothetical protein CFC21_000665 [Triticum aestivum]VAH01427.1 unnamed protein product [Triticum turgidum subsp. durum]
MAGGRNPEKKNTDRRSCSMASRQGRKRPSSMASRCSSKDGILDLGGRDDGLRKLGTAVRRRSSRWTHLSHRSHADRNPSDGSQSRLALEDARDGSRQGTPASQRPAGRERLLDLEGGSGGGGSCACSIQRQVGGKEGLLLDLATR